MLMQYRQNIICIVLFRLPKDPIRRKRWMDHLWGVAPNTAKVLQQKKAILFCSQHFTKEDFMECAWLRNNLKPDALPSQFPVLVNTYFI